MPRILIPLRPILGVLQIGIKSQGYREPGPQVVMSADSVVTYTSVPLRARSWSIPSEDPLQGGGQSEDFVPAEDEAPTPTTTTPLFLSPRTPPLLPIPLPTPSTSRRADIPEADTPPRKRLLLTTPRPSCVVGRVRLMLLHDSQDHLWAHSVDHSLVDTMGDPRVALEARVTVLETEVRRHKWQRQAADDLAIQHIMHTQALEAGARVDTLEDTGSSS
ncbi:hypothetical protein Tco_0269663 [Tanacetum coccineum]